jgi:hypothetical protein
MVGKPNPASTLKKRECVAYLDGFNTFYIHLPETDMDSDFDAGA